MRAVVFSRDRALQLEAFLRSYREHVTPSKIVHVLWRATTEGHANAYLDLFRETPDTVIPWRESTFRANTLSLLPRRECVVFFVDDQVFVRPWEIVERPGLSLRLGLHLTSNYASGGGVQAVPPHNEADGVVTWRWRDGELAWGYPLSLDGHVFDGDEFRSMAESIEFTSPNTLEAGLQRFAERHMDAQGSCYTESRVVNVPWNRVQTDCDNRFADGGDTADVMLAYWERGWRINIRPFANALNHSVHQEFPLTLEKRPIAVSA